MLNASRMHITPAEWAELIGRLPKGQTRGHISCIVWWDFFGGRTVENRWDDLDAYRAEYHWKWPTDEKALVNAMQKIGYSKAEAKCRILGIGTMRNVCKRIR